MGEKRIHIIVRGRVQGVFFRIHTQDIALKLDLSGWVRNCSDSSVEIVAEGNEKSLKNFEEWCYNGPPSSNIDTVDTKYSDSTGEFDTFRIKYY
jgi:acylphosphatase